MFNVPEVCRIRHGSLKSDSSYGNNGAFEIGSPVSQTRKLAIIASDGAGWEHVSVHVKYRGNTLTPTWDEMVFVKDLFWGEEDVVMQLHPKRSEYVNLHPNTLHLWRPISKDVPTPPKNLVGW